MGVVLCILEALFGCVWYVCGGMCFCSLWHVGLHGCVCLIHMVCLVCAWFNCVCCVLGMCI